jgi:hypothetical protein
MINWQSVIFNTFWILGLAIMLAAFSYHYWLAGQENRKLRLQLNEPGFLKPTWFGLGLIAIGLAGTSRQTWETIIWAVLALVALFLFISLFRQNL